MEQPEKSQKGLEAPQSDNMNHDNSTTIVFQSENLFTRAKRTVVKGNYNYHRFIIKWQK